MSEDKNTEKIVKKSHESDKKVENFTEDLEKKIEILGNEKSDLIDKIMRYQADIQNMERQSKEKINQEISKNKYNLLLEFITIYEDFIRAEDSLSKENIDTSGIDAIRKNMEKILSENNIALIDAVGKPFDPQIHEAISVVEDNSVDDGTIIQEVAKGYTAEKRILKPSKVIVSKKKSEK